MKMNPLELLKELDQQPVSDRYARKQVRNRRNLPEDFGEKWHNKYAGQKCVILANGPSLPSTELLQRIDCPVIGVNRSFLRVASDIHILVDKWHTAWYGSILSQLTPNASLRMSMYNIPGAYTPKRLSMNWVNSTKGDASLLPDIEKQGWLIRGASVGAFQIAYWLGFNPIIFAGLDLKYSGTHFYPEPDWMVARLAECHESVLLAQVRYFRDVKPVIDKRGIKVIQTTRGSGIRKLFELMDFEEVFGYE